MTGPDGTGAGEEDHTALHGKPPPDEGTGKEEILTQIFSLRNTPVTTSQRFAALAQDDEAESDNRSAATPSERLLSGIGKTEAATLPDFTRWLELIYAELHGGTALSHLQAKFGVTTT